MNGKRRALGRGLAALIPGAPVHAPVAVEAPVAAGAAVSGGGLRMVGIEDVFPWREQPRHSFDEARLEEMAESIRSQGVIQPLVVRPRDQGGGFEVIDGERRWRAAQRAGLHEIPVVVRALTPDRAFETALVANLQREDLNAIEQAEGYQRLMIECSYTQEMVASRVGKDRATVANVLRLLKLPAAARGLLAASEISMGHARALLGLESAEAIDRLARRAAAQQLSVRQVEALVRRERAGGTRPSSPLATPGQVPAAPSASARDLAQRMQRALGARVRIVEAGVGRGHVEIHYTSLDQLDALLARLLPP